MPPKKAQMSSDKAVPQSSTVSDASPRKRGRPAKTAPVEKVAGQADDELAEPLPKKKRGRPPKSDHSAPTAKVNADAEKKVPAKRGRPVKSARTKPVAEDDGAATAEPPKKRGRPPKDKSGTAPAVTEEEQAPPRKRGRPPLGGETTKMTVDDVAAADQLEGELLDTADEAPEPTRKRKPPAKKSGKVNAVSASVDIGDSTGAAGKNYWLMKAEQEDRFETAKNGKVINTKFTIDDLRAKEGPEPWDGVRNPTAAKNMRAMRKGDLAFFYASGGKQGRTPGITGIIEIVSEAEPDPTVSDEGAYGYVESESDRNRWCIVNVEFRKKLSVPVSLKELQNHTTGTLDNMQLLKQMRLSVSKVSEKEWDFIVNELIQSYEDV